MLPEQLRPNGLEWVSASKYSYIEVGPLVVEITG